MMSFLHHSKQLWEFLSPFIFVFPSHGEDYAIALGSHNSQDLTLDKIAIDIGKKDFSSDLSYVACSHV